VDVQTARHAGFARKAIEAAGKTVAPEASAEELAAHGRRLEAGRAANAAPPELTAEGRRDAALDKPSGAERAAGAVPVVGGAGKLAVHEGRSLKSAVIYPIGVAGRAVAAPLREVSEGAAGAATGGGVQGDSAVGRLLGAGIIGLGTLIVGSMLVKKDFAINLGGATPLKTATNLQKAYIPLYKGPGVAVVVPVPTPVTHGALP
jgi:hypothetical protein